MLSPHTKRSAYEVPAKLERSTQIPTHARGQVRALVKAHTDWSAFLTEKGLISASARNADLIEFALRHATLTAQIEAIIMPQLAEHSPQPAKRAEVREALVASNAAAEGCDMPAPESTVYVIERLLREFYARTKPRVRRQAGRVIA